MLLLVIALATASPGMNARAAEPTPANAEHARQLTQRLEQIRAIDTRELSRAERKALRTEVRTIKKELAAISGGVYLSVGALLLIALLLILLL